jgi:capsular polysaccharide biosynthesis protein
MELIQCPNSRHKLARIGKYLIPLELDLLRRGTTPAPTRRMGIRDLAAAYPAAITLSAAKSSVPLAPYELATVLEGHRSVETLPGNESVGYLASIQGGISYGRHCAVMTSGGEAVVESGHFATLNDVPVRRWSWAHLSGRDARRRWAIDLTSRRRLPRIRRIEGRVAALNLQYSHNYYHWLIDLLPRLATLRELGGAVDYYLVDCHTEANRRTLAMLGISERQMIQPHAALTLQASELLLPSFPTPGCLHAFRDMLADAAGNAPEVRPTATPQRLFISRRNARTRQLENEAEVEALLQNRGFETCLMEDHSLAQQARLINGAETIVGVHGAGLANLIFARRGVRVIELVHADRYNRLLFPQLSQTFGLRHWQVLASNGRRRRALSPSLSDLTIALDQAEQGLSAGRAA